MPFVLFRIDERLLHGQVLVGWGEALEIRYYAVVDDALAEGGWEQDLWRAGLPDRVEALFLSLEETVRRFPTLDEREEPGALITRETGPMRALAERGLLEGRDVDVGGIHDASGRRRALDYVFLGEDEVEDLKAISERGATVSARDLPGARRVPLQRLLRRIGG